jgi:hypothetical protein
VRHLEAACPFCGVQLALDNTPAPIMPRVRLGRAATFAFGATLAGAAALVGCSGEDVGKEGGGGMSSGGSGAGNSSAGNSNGGTGIAPVYGAPAAGMGGNNTFGGGPVYGAPPAGMSQGGNAGDGNMAGNANAGSGGSNIVPPYGAPAYGLPPAPEE